MQDLTGQKFGKLTVIKFNHKIKTNYGQWKYYWLCQCECGNEKIVNSSNLKTNNVLSCGCLQKENHFKKYDIKYKRIYNIWRGMKQRCYNFNNHKYNIYGARGIKICDEWLNDFMNFYNWSMNNNYQDNLSIDRIDVNGNYEPDNCRWADNITQTNNTRVNHYITYKGETHTLMEWSRKLGINRNTILGRLSRNWSIEKTLTVYPKHNIANK